MVYVESQWFCLRAASVTSESFQLRCNSSILMAAYGVHQSRTNHFIIDTGRIFFFWFCFPHFFLFFLLFHKVILLSLWCRCHSNFSKSRRLLKNYLIVFLSKRSTADRSRVTLLGSACYMNGCVGLFFCKVQNFIFLERIRCLWRAWLIIPLETHSVNHTSGLVHIITIQLIMQSLEHILKAQKPLFFISVCDFFFRFFFLTECIMYTVTFYIE